MLPSHSTEQVSPLSHSPSDLASYKIVKGASLRPRTKYPFEQLEVGDALYIPSAPDLTTNVSAKFHNAARRYRKHVPEFLITTQTQHTADGCFVVVFRVA